MTTTGSAGAGEWFLPVRTSNDPRASVLVFPHAGAGPANFADFASRLPDHFVVWVASLPGRQARLNETPRVDVEALVDEIVDHLPEQTRVSSGLLGYCGGALVAFLVARRLQARAAEPAPRLMVASFPAPDVAELPRRLPRLPSEAFWSALLEQGGLPDGLQVDQQLRPLCEPALRGDYALLAGYQHRRQPPLDVPLTVLWGRRDTTMRRGELVGWRRQTTQPLRLCALDGGHWLLDDAPQELAEAVAAELVPPTS